MKRHLEHLSDPQHLQHQLDLLDLGHLLGLEFLVLQLVPSLLERLVRQSGLLFLDHPLVPANLAHLSDLRHQLHQLVLLDPGDL